MRRAVLAAAGLVAVSVIALLPVRPQSDVPPDAPTVAQWNALPAEAPVTYQVTEIHIGDPRKDQYLAVTPKAINNAGQVVGMYRRVPPILPYWMRKFFHSPLGSSFKLPAPDPSPERAFFWDKGRVETLQSLQVSREADASFLNDRGQIVGEAESLPLPALAQNAAPPPRRRHVVLWENAHVAPHDLGAASGPALESQAFGLNARGQVGVQVYGNVPSPQNPGSYRSINQPYLWDNGSLRPMPADTIGFALNDSGEAVGVWLGRQKVNGVDADVELPVRLTPNRSTPRFLSALPFDYSGSEPHYFNNEGQITGNDSHGPYLFEKDTVERFQTEVMNFHDAALILNQNGDLLAFGEMGGVHGYFLQRKNQYMDISKALGPNPEWKISFLVGMNDRGQLIGWGYPTDPARLIHRHPGTDWTYQHILVLTPVLPQAGR